MSRRARTICTTALASGLLSGACLCAFAAPARAGDFGEIRYSVFGGTDNRSKDESKNLGKPYIGAFAEWRDEPGGVFYFAPGFETIDDNGAPIEWNVTAGVRPEFMGYDLHFNAVYKWRLTDEPNIDETELEFTADVQRSIGPANARLRVQYSPDAGGGTRSFLWTEARVGWRWTPKLMTNAIVGQRDRNGGTDYTSWNVGVVYDINDNVQLDLRYHDTNLENFSVDFDDTLVLSVFTNF